MNYHSPSTSFAESSLGVSKPNVDFVAGAQPQFSDETASLLRSRLSAASLVIFATLTAGFFGNLISGVITLWWARLAILFVLAASLLLLRSQRTSSIRLMRALELVVFGAVIVQLSMMLTSKINEFTSLADATSLAAVRQQFLMAWCVLIFVYGTFMPNTWKRAAAIVLPTSLLPYVIILLHCWWNPEVTSLLNQNRATSPLPLPMVSAVISAFASHVINSARREAFKARQLGQYRLMDRLGSGGMGEVYRAEHVLLKRPCAIKLIKPSTERDVAAVARFEKEVKNTAKLTHWNTIEIYDYGRTDDGTFYYVMELLPGMSLEDLVDRYGPLPPERVVYLLRQICGALQEAHSVGLIHRDVKPANIFISQRGGVHDVAKLLDFGLVKENSELGDKGSPESGSFSGTPLYMSPEQATSYDQVDGRSDLYALGAVAYFLLTGQPAFRGDNVVQLLVAHRSANVVPPSQLNPAVPADLDQIVIRCMAKNPEARFQNAKELAVALDQCSLANVWDPEKASRWWHEHDRIFSNPKPSGQSTDRTHNAAGLDVTLDDVPSEPSR